MVLVLHALVGTRGPAQEPAAAVPPLGITGTIRFHRAVPSRVVEPRHVEVWLPPGYERARERYPVLYIHDGQNVLAPATASFGVDWGVDETMARLIERKRVRPAIVVAVWSTPDRFAEYMPAKAAPPGDTVTTGIPGLGPAPTPLHSDAYLRFLVRELKPFIDRTYRTLRGPPDTFLMGSSMGGLISLYALTEYPAVFGGAACLSTHWPAGGGAMIDYLRGALPAPGGHRVYFDHGTAALDSLYRPLQRRADAVMRARGYVEGRNWVTRVFPGATHSERAWRVRVEEPLVFLLGR